MSTISVTDFKTITDKIAGAYVTWGNGVGTSTPASGTAGYKLGEVRSTVLTLNDVDQEIALLSPADASYKAALAPNSAPAAFKSIILGLRNHISSFDTYCSANNARVAPEFRNIAALIPVAIATSNTFTDTVDPIGLWTAGDGVGTYSEVATVNTTLYSWKANLKVITTATIGASTITATLTCLTGGSTATVEKAVVIPASTSISTTIDVGTVGTDMYQGVTGVTCSGMTNGDAFKIIAARERPLT